MKSLRTMMVAGSIFLCVGAQRAVAQQAAADSAPIFKQKVTFKSGALTLVGFVFKPAGRGPFPTVIWNHGSEKTPSAGRQFDSAAAVFMRAGYATFAPVRRGHDDSQGEYVKDATDEARAAGGAAAANALVVKLLESQQLDDQLAGAAYARTLTFVDSTRMAVAGCSYGGIQTLLAAERGAGFKAAVSISPAALSWMGNPLLQARLLTAVGKIAIPVMLIQPPKDASLEPSRVLGAEFKRLGKVYVGKVYPTTIPEDLQPHCFGGAKGMHIWADDALAFLKPYLK